MADKQRFTIRTLVTDGPVFIGVIGIVLLLSAGFIPLRHALFARKAAAMVRTAGADSCTIGQVTLVAWRSVRCSNVSIVTAVDSLRTCRIHCGEITIDASLPALLSQRNALRRTRIPADGERSEISYSRLYALLRMLAQKKGSRVNGISVTVSGGQKEIVRGIKGTARLSAGKKKKETVLLTMDFPVATVAGDGLQQVHADVRAGADGTVTVSEVRADYFDGRISGKAVIDQRRKRFASYTCGIDTMDIAYWYTVHAGIGEIHGKLSAEAKGGDIPWDSLFSRVRLKLFLEDCTVAGLPIQKALATSLFLPSIATLDFSSISATAEMKEPDTIQTTFKGRGDQLDFSSEGWVMLNGRLHQKFNGVFSGKMAASFPDVVKNSLIPAGKGKRKLTCRLFGTYHEPRFELDEATLRRAVGNMFDGLRQEIIDIHNGR